MAATILIDDYPQLRAVVVNRPKGARVTREEALSLYEAGWRHVHPDLMSDKEKALLEGLIAHEGHGILNV